MNNISFFLFLGLLVLGGCSSTSPVVEGGAGAAQGVATDHSKAEKTASALSLRQSRISFDSVYSDWKGTPYRLGGNSKRGIDCSAFVQIGYSSVFNQRLPRTTGELATVGQWIPLREAVKGDLVFFKTGRRMRHVGIYLGNDQFLHASTSQGVVISRLDNPYWRQTFWQARRVRTL